MCRSEQHDEISHLPAPPRPTWDVNHPFLQATTHQVRSTRPAASEPSWLSERESPRSHNFYGRILLYLLCFMRSNRDSLLIVPNVRIDLYRRCACTGAAADVGFGTLPGLRHPSTVGPGTADPPWLGWGGHDRAWFDGPRNEDGNWRRSGARSAVLPVCPGRPQRCAPL